MRIGVHPLNLHLRLAQGWPGLFPETFTFVPYPEGRDTGTLISARQFQAGGTGSTPPLISQAEGLSVVYVAASAPRPANGALLVAPEAAVQSLADLKGRRVALIDGSFHTYLLARSLDQAGLGLADVTRVELSPAASRLALIRGEVDVWIAMAPQIESAIGAGEARLLALCGSTIPNRSVFWTLADAGLSDTEIRDFVARLIRLGEEIAADPDRAAQILAGPGAKPESLAQWRRVVAGRDWTILPADPTLIAEQQAEADTLTRHGDFDRALQISAFLAA
ncbi:ABC transporter substrate-binding protein [Pseudomonas sp. GX19020]|uniref:ABC transporter substrate-binding protein n=1 Tax=Pseudomonas sp. GX19020 TaxID=2942277 RepID=UPI0020190139|nr:ABC transporter substrate-binding protein [Pseudomonas sp. GX19020]MCL4068032.1 ABC transporter substrate-binding protein [Pseudomonas sp. GX19020]